MIAEKGYGKRTPVADYPEQNRGGQGVYAIQVTIKKGLLAGLEGRGAPAPAHDHHRPRVWSFACKVNDISQLGRSTQGVKIMDAADGDKVAALARMKQSKPKAKLPEGQAFARPGLRDGGRRRGRPWRR